VVRVSHAKCRQCGQTRHRNAKANLCGRCWRQRKPEIQQQWRDIKARRAQTRNGHVEAETEAPLTIAAAIEEVQEEVAQRQRVMLSPEQKQEIVDLYMNSDTPVKEIAATYGVPETAPFRLLSEAGISWRRGDRVPETRLGPKRELPPHIAAMQDVHVAPEPVKPSLLDQPAPELEEIVKEAFELEKAATPNGRVPEVDLSEGGSRWSVVYVTTTTLSVRADSFDEAAAKARAVLGDGIEIEMVRRERS